MGQRGERSYPVSNREPCYRRPPGGGSRALPSYSGWNPATGLLPVPEQKNEGRAAGPFVQDREGDDPATTSAIDHPGTAVGQLLCVDRDALAAMLAAGVLASSPEYSTTNGCQTIPEDAQVEVLERYPTGFHSLRTVKVKVTAPSLPNPNVGYTIEVGR